MRAILIVVVVVLSNCSGSTEKSVKVDSAGLVVQYLDSSFTPSSTYEGKGWKPFVPRYNFKAFPASKYKGEIAEPNFSEVDYKDEDGFKAFLQHHSANTPINFAGKYSIIENSCGAMCSSIYLIDRQSGKIFSFPGSEGHWGYKYCPNSTLLVANANLINDSFTGYLDKWGIEPEYYKWTGKNFKRLP